MTDSFKDLPVGLAFSYLKGSLASYSEFPQYSQLAFQVRSARRLFIRASDKNKSFLSRRLRNIAENEGWLND